MYVTQETYTEIHITQTESYLLKNTRLILKFSQEANHKKNHWLKSLKINKYKNTKL